MSGSFEELVIAGSRWSDLRFFGADGRLVALYGDVVSAMGRTRADLDAICVALGIEWEATADELLDEDELRDTPEDYARAVVAQNLAAIRVERAAQRRAAENGALSSDLAQKMRAVGITCPHCALASKSHRYVESRKPYFVCTSCNCSFDARQL